MHSSQPCLLPLYITPSDNTSPQSYVDPQIDKVGWASALHTSSQCLWLQQWNYKSGSPAQSNTAVSTVKQYVAGGWLMMSYNWQPLPLFNPTCTVCLTHSKYHTQSGFYLYLYRSVSTSQLPSLLSPPSCYHIVCKRKLYTIKCWFTYSITCWHIICFI